MQPQGCLIVLALCDCRAVSTHLLHIAPMNCDNGWGVVSSVDVSWC